MTSPDARVRSATLDDAAACRSIYAPYVEETAISFEDQAPSLAEMRTRIGEALRTHAWVVLEEGGGVVGYAYGGPHKSRAAYRWTCEVSVYVEPGRRRTGAGRRLYEALFEVLADRGYLIALAGMTLPNASSAGLHRSLGFEDVGTWRRIGWKQGSWHDTHWMQRPLGEPTVRSPAPPADPR
jgi:L-amino acid N-acyltransferase YncA